MPIANRRTCASSASFQEAIYFGSFVHSPRGSRSQFTRYLSVDGKCTIQSSIRQCGCGPLPLPRRILCYCLCYLLRCVFDGKKFSLHPPFCLNPLDSVFESDIKFPFLAKRPRENESRAEWGTDRGHALALSEALRRFTLTCRCLAKHARRIAESL